MVGDSSYASTISRDAIASVAPLRTTKEKRGHKASIRSSMTKRSTVFCLGCRKIRLQRGFPLHLKMSFKCREKYKRIHESAGAGMLDFNSAEQETMEEESSCYNDEANIVDGDWGLDNDMDFQDINQEVAVHDDEVEWMPPLVKIYHATRGGGEDCGQGPTSAYIEVQEKYLGESLSRPESISAIKRGDLNETLRGLAAAENQREGVGLKKDTHDSMKDRLYGALSTFQYESNCNGDRLLAIIRDAIEYNKVLPLPESFRTITRWTERKLKDTMPDHEVVPVPLPQCWNVHSWPPEARMQGPVNLIINDPIALLSMKFIHPRTWGLWGTEIKLDSSHREGNQTPGKNVVTGLCVTTNMLNNLC
jgi:hypothetical protein